MNIRCYDGAKWPCINVKCYNFPSPEDVKDRYKCSDRTAMRCFEMLYECAQEEFWEEAGEKIVEIFHDDSASVYQHGRSGGWLSVSILRNKTEVEDFEEEVDEECSNRTKEAYRLYDEAQTRMGELEVWCRGKITELSNLDYWKDTIDDLDLVKGWTCPTCGTFHDDKLLGKLTEDGQ